MMPAPMIVNGADPIARFDAADGRGRSFELRGILEEVVAWELGDVVPAIDRISDAAESGLHAGGFIAYEAAAAFDPKLVTHRPFSELPLLWFGIFRTRVDLPGIDHRPDDGDAGAIWDWHASLDIDEYIGRVEGIRRLIEAGDTYQVNLTFPMTSAGAAGGLYRRLLQAQRAGYGAYLQGDFGTVISASPELFFRRQGDEIELRPMKGTRPRGRWAGEDDGLVRELIESPKERAENLMIVDLLRNDVGRVAVTGSVKVPRLFDVESYPTVHQLTSTITARTRPDVTLSGLLSALFPSGSVTGAPKIRTMEIIREMEDGPRGVYTGAVGFVSPGESVFNVPIRTIWRNPGGEMRLGVGSGITYDADPRSEYAECIQKAAFVRHRPVTIELLETMGWDPVAGVRRLPGHLKRFASSARYFGIPLDLMTVEHVLEEAIASAREELIVEKFRCPEDDAAGSRPDRPPALRVRLVVDRRGAARAEATRFEASPAPLRACIGTLPVDSADPMWYHKTTHRRPYDERRASHPTADDVLMINERGELTEFTTGNLIVRIDGRSFTPPVCAGLLPGVARAEMLERGEIVERILTPGDLDVAEAIYHLNSLRGLTLVEVSR